MKKLILSLLLLASIASLSFADRIKWFEITYLDKQAGNLHVLAGSTIQLGASGRYKDKDYDAKNDQPSWSTNNYNIAEINDRGELRALRPGTVKVFATKDKLTAAATITVTSNEAEAMPSTPTGLKVINITSSSATVTWDDPKNKNGINYLLNISTNENAEGSGLPFAARKPFQLKGLPFMHKLNSDTKYFVKIKAFDQFGVSDWTKPVSFKTLK
jgi:Bacterial Ig-like domain (group 2)/Fibronectin type III domain